MSGFERFTERARQVVVLAQDEARALKHNYIGTEHLLLGLLREEEGLAARVLDSLDITVEEVRAQVARTVSQSDEIPTGQLPFTPRAKKVRELALREALSLGHNYIGTEHLLLGLVRENEGVAARILLDFDADPDNIRNKVVQMLTGPSNRRRQTAIDSWIRFKVEPRRAPSRECVWVELEATRVGDDSSAHFQLSRRDSRDLAKALSEAAAWLQREEAA